jgi:hypothetical protein
MNFNIKYLGRTDNKDNTLQNRLQNFNHNRDIMRNKYNERGLNTSYNKTIENINKNRKYTIYNKN